MNPLHLFRHGVNHAHTPLDASQSESLREVMQRVYVTETASPALQERVAALAMQHNQKRVMSPFRLSHYLPRLAAFAACALFVCVIAAWPFIRTAYLLYRMQSAILNARTVCVETRSYDTQVGARKVTIFNSLWRVETESPHYVELYSNGKLLSNYGRYDPRHRPNNPLPPLYQWANGVDLAASPSSAALNSLLVRLERSSEQNINGRPATLYAMRYYFEEVPTRYLWIDESTHLPIKIELIGKRKGVWRHVSKSEFQFNQAVDFQKFVRL